jgi:hypothetical protein
MPAAEQALEALARQLREDDSIVSPYARHPGSAEPSLGLLGAAGPAAAGDPGEYALLIETIREGYLLHYGTGRVVIGADGDLALLAGDYLYARGLERLAALGDLGAVRELADLISLSAQLHAEGREGVRELWLASVTAIGAGPSAAHEEAKSSLRRGDPEAPGALWDAARAAASGAGIGERLEHAAEAIGFQPR